MKSNNKSRIKRKKQRFANRPGKSSKISIPGRSRIVAALSKLGKPARFEELCALLDVSGDKTKDALNGRLQRMQGAGQIIQDRRKRFALPKDMHLLTGRVIGHADGYGFVVPEEGGSDLYLSPRQMRRVLHGDRILASILRIDKNGRREGAVVELIDSHPHVVGRYLIDQGIGFVQPDDRRIPQDIHIPPNRSGKAKDGQIVVVEITEHPIVKRHIVGKVIEILGDHMAPGMETEIAIRKYDLPHKFSRNVTRQAKEAAAADISKELPRCTDFCDVPMVTIDGEDARDFDDAVFCEPKGKGWRLLVAIADVSYYVRPGTELDGEAYARGNSVYFSNRVLPMLPHTLSNGMCSLNPDEDRLCMVCDMRINQTGEVKSTRFLEGIMRSNARLTYTQVAAYLDNRDTKPLKRYKHVAPQLDNLYAVFQVLLRAREKRGSIDLDIPEAYIEFDKHSRIKNISARHRNHAHRLIEECMLAANVAAARYISKHRGGAVYRVHDAPGTEKLMEVRQFLAGLGLSLGGGDSPSAKDYANSVNELHKRPEIEDLVQTVLLRSLSQAMYSAEKGEHFALNYPMYTHFTSPIRRYPDLVVHRIIKTLMHKEHKTELMERHLSLPEMADHCSFTERRADDATRDAVQWLKAEYMLDKIGDTFDGTVSGVTAFGLFVQLDAVFVEGLIHITALGNDYYDFDPLKYQLVGQRSGRVFRLGDKLNIRVVAVNLDEAKIDFELNEPTKRSKKSTRRATKKAKKTALRKRARKSR